MFPQFAPQLLENTQNSSTTRGKSLHFDFGRGDFVVKDGKPSVLDGIAALKIRVEKVLKTEKFKFKIYETGIKSEYGVTLLELVNSGFPQFFIQAEMQREITEALSNDPEILSIDGFEFNRDKRTLSINFNINSIYGSINQEVRF